MTSPMKIRFANLLRAGLCALSGAVTSVTVAQESGEAPGTAALTIAEFQKTAEQWVKKPTRVGGTVTGFWGSAFFLESPSGAMFVFNDQRKGYMRIGDAVEVSGLAVTGGMTAHLRAEEVRVLGPGVPPVARFITIPEALSGKYDARVVRLRGRVASAKPPESSSRTVLLSADATDFTAEFVGDSGSPGWSALLPGQPVEATGILSVRGAGDSSPVPFRLLLRSHRDIASTGPQPWWMPPRFYRVLMLAALVLGAGLFWGVTLRRQVRAQAEKIRDRYAREKAVEERYRGLFESANDLILTHDLSGQITSLNPAGERLLGWRAEEIVGRNLAEFLAREERETRGGIIAPGPTATSGNGVVFQLDLLTRDGRNLPVEISSWTETRDGQPVGRQAICRDLSERRTAEAERARLDRKLQESQKLESLGILAGGVAHDFNNLLTSILGNASLAQMEAPADSPILPCLQQIEVASERAAGLCQQMLAYSGQGRFVVMRADLSAIIRENTELLRASIHRNIVFDIRLAENLPTTIADVTQMRQMLMNLVVNAGEAIGDQAGTITIATGVRQATRAELSHAHLSPELPEGEYVMLEVSDTGGGIDEAIRDKIFDPFFTTKFTGRGLGLAAVLGIVRGHRGAIYVTSKLGAGSSFRVLLPSSGAPSLQTEFPFQSASGSAGLILVVDDEEPVRISTRRMLEALGYEVVTAGDGLAAVAQVRQRGARLSAVILDLTMPQMDGAETFREMRLLQPDLRVVLMSGFAEPQAMARFAGQGLTGFLQKPFNSNQLGDKLTEALESALVA